MAAKTGPHPDVPCVEGCGAMLKHNPRRQTGRCRPCAEAAVRLVQEHCEVCGAALGRRTKRKWLRCRRHVTSQPDSNAQRAETVRKMHADPAFQERRGRAIRAAKLSHIPLEYRDAYMELLRTKGMPAAERIDVIQNQIAADRRAFEKTGILPQTARSTT